MSDVDDASTARTLPVEPVADSALGRLYRGQTAVDFHRRRRLGLVVTVVLLLATVASLTTRGLDLGIDFEGGTSWDVPAATFGIAEAQSLLVDNGIETDGARLQLRESESGTIVKVQVSSVAEGEAERLRAEFASAAGVTTDDVGLSVVSASWGADVTNKAIRALVIFILAVAVFISLRFEWRMALAAILAMVHDVVITVGLYSILGLVVTPATVIAFLTILGYSLYDTIVVFDRVRENETRFAGHRVPYADILNVSMNQVVMRSLNTSISSLLPVISLLAVGAGLLGASALSEFALALLLGMATGTYSSILIAAPTLAWLKSRTQEWSERSWAPATGDALRALVLGGVPVGRRRGADQAEDESAGRRVADAAAILSHAPRPRKKRRR
ncbi:MAG: protein translocase subunit SecF [Ilumatobacteraceae bacterium]|jgi:preprotein translocase subunit SecF